jgi:hypothetical protein
LSTGAQKLGQPVLESNLALDENSKAPQQTHLKRPGRFSRLSWLEKGRSVPCCRGDVQLLRRELFFPFVIAFRDGWSGIGVHVVPPWSQRAFKHPLGRSGTVGKSTLSSRPAIGTMREKSACNAAGAAVETAEIAVLRTLVS